MSAPIVRVYSLILLYTITYREVSSIMNVILFQNIIVLWQNFVFISHMYLLWQYLPPWFKIYLKVDWQSVCTFPIVNFPFISSDIQSAPIYVITRVLLYCLYIYPEQDFFLLRLKSPLHKFKDRFLRNIHFPNGN